MRFEFQHALRDLGSRTPTYFLEEIFHHGSLKVRTASLAALEDLNPKRRTTRVLKEMLRLV